MFMVNLDMAGKFYIRFENKVELPRPSSRTSSDQLRWCANHFGPNRLESLYGVWEVFFPISTG